MGMHTCRVLNLADPGQRIEGMINGRKINIPHNSVVTLSDVVIDSLKTSTQIKWNETVTAYTEEPSFSIQIIESDVDKSEDVVDTNRRASADSVQEEESKEPISEEDSEVKDIEEAEAEMMADLEEYE